MKHRSSTLWLSSTLLLLSGCGGGYSAPPASPALSEPSVPQPQGLNIAGNWQFNITSTAGMSPATMAGSIAQSGNSVSGAVHVDGSNCFDRMATVGLTGTLTGSDISLTSAPVAPRVVPVLATEAIPDEQVTVFTGTISQTGFTGTYAVNGGCADGDRGNITGVSIPPIFGHLPGTFTASGGETFDVAADNLKQSSATSDGTFGLSGIFSAGTTCFGGGTIVPGTFPSGSFILGTSVALEIETSNGTVTFNGTLNQDKGEISGDYTIFGGTCDQTGTGIFDTTSPWDY